VTRIVKIGRDAVFLAGFIFLGSLIIAKLDIGQVSAINGPFFAIDGDTLAAGAERLRLVDIDAPEADQTCGDGKGGEWACGDAAREALSKLAASSMTECRGDARDRYSRVLVSCRRGDLDINREMVRLGMAVASGGYGREETAAKDAGEGIWAGPFERPKSYRAAKGAMEDDESTNALFDRLGELFDQLKAAVSW
jgi:endonuclease YncB( thermonuclease family)